MKLLLPVLLFVIHASSYSQTQDAQYFYTAARTAYKEKDHLKFYELIREANKLHPYHPGILYHVGIAAALNGKSEEAITYLSRAIQINAEYDLNNESLISLRAAPAFITLQKEQGEIKKSIITSDTAMTIKDRSLHIESVAKNKEKFYLGSIHQRKIIVSDNKGSFQDFTTSGQDGLTSVFGLKVDIPRKLLWACASPMAEMENFDTLLTSAVFKYDLNSGKLLGKYETPDKRESIFGDLTLDSKGNVFISDTKNNIIYTVNEKTKSLDEFFKSPEFWNIQGLSFAKDDGALFIADYIRGIFKLDIKTKKLQAINSTLKESLKSIDGLTYYKGSLIAIQNLISPMRVTQYLLSASEDEIVGLKIIDRAHPAFNEPTLGVLDGNQFYYVANSLWSGYTKDHQLKATSELQDVVILKVDLKRLK